VSYSFSVPAGPAEDLRERAAEAAARLPRTTSGWVKEADDDIEAAVDAAVRLAQSLTEGDGAVDVAVTISGHANAGRTAPQGWSNDSVNVNVAKAKPAV